MADEMKQGQDEGGATADGGDAGTKGTGSAGAQADAEDGDSANIGDAGTKGTGSAG